MKLADRVILPYPTHPHRPLVFAHRGASSVAPENTLPAFQLARDQRADGVELDAMVCGSGEVVVCHDPWLDRLAGSHACVHHRSLSELQQLDVSAAFPSWKGTARIPSLDEVLGSFPELLINIELKEERLRDTGLARGVADLVRQHRAEHRVVISSFNPLELLRLRAHAPRLPLAFLFEEEQPTWARSALPAPLLATQSVHPEHTLITVERLARWQALGFKVGAWTVDDPVRAEQLALLGVDTLITNAPARILQHVERIRRFTG